MITIPAITLWQPWASFIAAGWKTIETRTHNRFACLLGQRIAIHAGKRWDEHWLELAGPYLSDQQRRKVMDFWRVRSAVVAVATVAGRGQCEYKDSQAALIDCSGGWRFGLWLENVEVLERPLLAKGRQGIWQFNLVDAT